MKTIYKEECMATKKRPSKVQFNVTIDIVTKNRLLQAIDGVTICTLSDAVMAAAELLEQHQKSKTEETES